MPPVDPVLPSPPLNPAAMLGAMPRQEVEKSRFIASDFMSRIWGAQTGPSSR
jgi:hypothetical protein